MFRLVLSRIWGTFRKHRLDEEFDEELKAHLDMLQERFIRRGMDPTEAFYAARRQFGGVTQVKQDLRERRALPLVDLLLQDVRHAFRRLRKSKRVTVSAALTLALGVGATISVFAVLDTVVLKPLPYAEADRLMAFRLMDRRGSRPATLSYPNFLDFRRENRVFEHLVSYRDAQFTLTDSLPAVSVTGEIVSWDLFPMLGIQPALGRGFRSDEEQPGTHVVVLSHTLWMNRFGGNRDILGKAIPVNGVPFTVIGVAPEGFQFPMDVTAIQLWVTFSDEATAGNQRGARMLDVVGRLKPRVSVEQARTQLDLVARALATQYPDSNGNFATTWIQPESERVTGLVETPILILLGAVTLVLLIACANVASLLLARSIDRMREFALQVALGASRLALVRQSLVESVTLGLLGALGGLLLAIGVLREILPLAGDRIPRLAETSVDGRVLAFSALLAVLTSVMFGLVPALQAASADPINGLKAGARSIAPGHDRFQSALVVGQIALGLVLLASANVLIASFLNLTQRDPGFRSDNLLTLDIGLPQSQYGVAEQVAFSDRLLERMKAIPGVQAAATGTPLPLQGHEMTIGFDIEERPAGVSDRPRSDVAIVSPGYFTAMGIPVLKGRDFGERDDARALPVLVVNEAFARKYFPGEDVIGKRIQPGVGTPPLLMREIVGVVGDAKQAVLGTDSDPIYYFPYKQLPWRIGTIVLRTAILPQEIAPAAREALTNLDRAASMSQIRTGEGLSAAVTAPARLVTVLMSSFAALALLLTVAGLYGVLSYMVARRRREIGVRAALGAGRGEVIAIVWRRAALLVAIGLIVGSVGAFGVGRVLANLLGSIPAGIAVMVAGACCAIAIASSVATLVPAAQAASVDPIETLRSE
jgi:putative ABC transport system permease protein